MTTLKSIIKIFFLIYSAQGISEIIEFDTPSGETISIHESQATTKDNLFINISSYRGLSPEFTELLPKMAELGINTWTLDLINSYMLAPTPESFREIPPSDITAVIREAKLLGYRNIFLYSTSKSSNYALKVTHDYQKKYKDKVIKGHVMHVPELWITNPKTSETTINEVAKTSNLPIYLLMSEYGTKYHLTQKIITILQSGGSSVFVHVLKGVRSGFHMRPKSHLTDFDIKKKEGLPLIYKNAAFLLPTINYNDLMVNGYNAAKKREYGNELVKIPVPKESPKTKLPTMDGGMLDLSSYSGKKLLINFWASWCKSCATEIPSMTRLKNTLGDELEIITINIGEDEDLIAKFKKQVPFDFPIMMDITGATMRDWGVFVYPSNFILNTMGEIVYTYTGSIEWDQPYIIKIIKEIK